MEIQLKCCLTVRFGSIVTSCDFEQTLGFFCLWEYFYEYFFTLRVTKRWNRLPRQIVEAPLETLKAHLDGILCSLILDDLRV